MNVVGDWRWSRMIGKRAEEWEKRRGGRRRRRGGERGGERNGMLRKGVGKRNGRRGAQGRRVMMFHCCDDGGN